MNEASTLLTVAESSARATARVGAMRPARAWSGSNSSRRQGGVACRALAATGGGALEWRAARCRIGACPRQLRGGARALQPLSRPRTGSGGCSGKWCSTVVVTCWPARGCAWCASFWSRAGCRRCGASYGTQQPINAALESRSSLGREQRRALAEGMPPRQSRCAKTKPCILRCVGWLGAGVELHSAGAIRQGSHGGDLEQALTAALEGLAVEVIQGPVMRARVGQPRAKRARCASFPGSVPRPA